MTQGKWCYMVWKGEIPYRRAIFDDGLMQCHARVMKSGNWCKEELGLLERKEKLHWSWRGERLLIGWKQVAAN